MCPFIAGAEARPVTAEYEKSKEKDKGSEVWAPCFETCDDIQAGIAATMIVPTQTKRKLANHRDLHIRPTTGRQRFGPV